MSKNTNSLFNLAVIVSALGFFVDVYDLLLFAIIRKPSLSDLGLDASEILTQGEYLISIQMIGLLLGGILFGIIGDKRGRLSVLFGSILMYSIANILNGMVVNINQYAILRFIAGVGLAGELGAGVTLVSELLPKEKRSIATGFIAGFGIFGVVFAFALSRFFDWRTCYYIGGGLGILLLLLRVQVRESILFSQVKEQSIVRGNFLMFFSNKKRFYKYLQCVLMGLPVWYIIGILVTFSDQFGKAFGIEDIDPAKAIVFLYSAIAFGDFAVGWLSERLHSRRITYFIFAGIAIVFCSLYFLQKGGSANTFYLLCAGMGFGAGFNVVYITMGVEQFGTNLRASAAISIPNMVRGALPLIIWLFKSLRVATGDYLTGAWITGVILFVLAIVSAWLIEETYGKDLNFVEE